MREGVAQAASGALCDMPQRARFQDRRHLSEQATLDLKGFTRNTRAKSNRYSQPLNFHFFNNFLASIREDTHSIQNKIAFRAVPLRHSSTHALLLEIPRARADLPGLEPQTFSFSDRNRQDLLQIPLEAGPAIVIRMVQLSQRPG